MTDSMPYRAQMLGTYLLYEHDSINSSHKFNNLIQLPLDSVYYQEGFPYCMYSPAYAPNFKVNGYLKNGQTQNFGIIVIS